MEKLIDITSKIFHFFEAFARSAVLNFLLFSIIVVLQLNNCNQEKAHEKFVRDFVGVAVVESQSSMGKQFAINRSYFAVADSFRRTQIIKMDSMLVLILRNQKEDNIRFTTLMDLLKSIHHKQIYR